jgi:long-chain acyl-CoA synthetase
MQGNSAAPGTEQAGAHGHAGNTITPEEAGTLDGLFRERLRRTPGAIAYRHYDDSHANWRDYTWMHMERLVARWQAALRGEGLQPGDRVAIMLRNSPDWVAFDIAALGLGLVTVPLYTHDRAENVAYILQDSGCTVLLFDHEEQWRGLSSVCERAPSLQRLLSARPIAHDGDSRLRHVDDWLPDEAQAPVYGMAARNSLATIIYTSGTTGRPKGVMLSHYNILANAYASLEGVMHVDASYTFLSFLPLSHSFERTCGYYLPMMGGATVAYSRSVQQLGEDLRSVQPTVLVSVPRVYERIWGTVRDRLQRESRLKRALFSLAVSVGYARFEHAQGRAPWRPSLLLWPVLQRLVARKVLARLGGRLRVALSGGAALSPHVARVFIGLGLPVVQGYGLTEASPVVCANRLEDNVPASVGRPIPGVEARVSADGELIVRGPSVMQGYWQDRQATAAAVSADGWLSTGDLVRIDEGGRVYITGRLKDVLVLSNGEKISPNDVEAAILRDPLFEQVMLIGEGRPYVSLVAVLDEERWRTVSAAAGLDPADVASRAAERLIVKQAAAQLTSFPGYLQVRRVIVSREQWSVENGFMTPTLKLRRESVLARFDAEIDRLYAGL